MDVIVRRLALETCAVCFELHGHIGLTLENPPLPTNHHHLKQVLTSQITYINCSLLLFALLLILVSDFIETKKWNCKPKKLTFSHSEYRIDMRVKCNETVKLFALLQLNVPGHTAWELITLLIWRICFFFQLMEIVQTIRSALLRLFRAICNGENWI